MSKAPPFVQKHLKIVCTLLSHRSCQTVENTLDFKVVFIYFILPEKTNKQKNINQNLHLINKNFNRDSLLYFHLKARLRLKMSAV